MVELSYADGKLNVLQGVGEAMALAWKERLLEKTQVRRKKERIGEPPSISGALAERFALYEEELEVQNDELRRIQDDLGEACTHYQGIFELAPIAYLVLDDRGEIVEANQAVRALLDSEALVGKALAGFLSQDDADSLHRYLVSLRNDRRPPACAITLNRGGRPSAVKMQGSYLRQKEGSLFCLALLETETAI